MEIQKYLRGQIWWCKENNKLNIFPGIQAGERPVLIVSNDIGNIHSPILTVVPLTSQEKKNLPTHVRFYNNITMKDNIVLCEQIKTVPAEFLTNYLGTLKEEVMTKVAAALLITLGFSQEEIQGKQKEIKCEPITVSNDTQVIVKEVEKKKDKPITKQQKEMLRRYMKQHTIKETVEEFAKGLNKEPKKLYWILTKMRQLDKEKENKQ